MIGRHRSLQRDFFISPHSGTYIHLNTSITNHWLGSPFAHHSSMPRHADRMLRSPCTAKQILYAYPSKREPIMSEVMDYPMTHQGVRDLDRPIRRIEARVNVGPDERTASTLGGSVLAGFGLAHGGLEGLLCMISGAALVYRGVTGHCSAYAAAGINTAK
jgi:hypothetical protein